MKLLLTAINSKYIHSNLALHSIKAYAKAYAPYVALEEYTINSRLDDVLRDIYKKGPQVIALSCYIWNVTYIKNLVTELNKILPTVPIWLGGPEVTYNSEGQLSEFPAIKGIVVGEGEATFLELVQYYVEEDRDLSAIKGLVYREESGEIIRTEPREILSMDALEFPYEEDLTAFEHRIIYYESTRGCPYGCKYCLSSTDNLVRYRSFDQVQKELDFFLKAKVKQVKFVDRTFNCNKKRAMQLWEYLHTHDNGITNFHFEISADLIDDDMLVLLRKIRPGLFQFEIGVQSTYGPTLESIQRTMDFQRLEQVVRTLKDANNIHLHLDLIAGLPKEDYERFQNSFNEVYALLPEQLQLGFLKVLKGTRMHHESGNYGLVYQSVPPYEVLTTNVLSYDDLLNLKMVEDMVETYYNSGQFTYTLKYLETRFSTPFQMFEAIGRYYESENLHTMQHARITKYDILLRFYHRTFGEEDQVFKALMLIDLYLQENLKKRPNWYEDNPCVKQEVKRLYHDEAFVNKYLQAYKGYEAKQIQRMTHIEPIGIDLSGWIEGVDNGLILFDYLERDPLTHHAKMIPLTYVSRG